MPGLRSTQPSSCLAISVFKIKLPKGWLIPTGVLLWGFKVSLSSYLIQFCSFLLKEKVIPYLSRGEGIMLTDFTYLLEDEKSHFHAKY